MIVRGFKKSGPTIRPWLNSRPHGSFYPDPAFGMILETVQTRVKPIAWVF